jgi:hydrophobic/amphiphilic exporter-1 (mainly G- bacteria), HAE1 family
LFSQVYGKTSGVVAQEILAKVQKAKFPTGVQVQLTGQQEYMAESFVSLGVALFAAILFVYMIMVALYNSFLYPFVVLFSIPVAVVGALYGLALTGKSISIYSILGIIMLVGLVAKNAILLVDRTNQMRSERGMSTYDALLEAGQTRLRPILMTTFSMIMGMMPIALSTSAGSETKSSMGVVIIGGLTTSMFLTLVVVPVVYLKFDKWKTAIAAFFRRVFRIKPNVETI